MAEPTTATSQERTLGQLVAQATDDMSAILRAEMALAKAEIAADVRNGAVAGGLFGAAGYLGLLASILLSIAAANGYGENSPGGYGLVAVGLAPWLAFLVVALVCLLLAAVLVLVGKSRVSRVGPPERAMRSARQTIAAVTPTRSR